MENTTPSKEQLRHVLGLAGALFEEHRHQFIYSHLDEVAMIENHLNTLLGSIKAERREYEQWLDNQGEHEEQYCPQCGGEPTLLGTLGNLTHLRCRACGWDFTAS